MPVHLVGRASVRRVLEESRTITAWIELPARRLDRLRLAWRLRAEHYAAAILLAPSFSAAVFAAMTGAAHRIGEAADGRGLLLTHPLPRSDRNRHLSLSYHDPVVASLGILGIDRPDASKEYSSATALPAPRIQVRQSEMHALRELPPGIEGAVVVAPGARFGPAKQYPPERFADAASALASRWGCEIVLVGTREDAAATSAVHHFLPAAIDLAGRTSLGQLLAILQQATVTLANDSGTMHLAAAVGGAVVGVFGSTNPQWTAPLGARARYIVHPVFCAPCYARTCREDFACMLNQPAAALAAAAQQLVESGHA
jgi:heptosyltransferase-2